MMNSHDDSSAPHTNIGSTSAEFGSGRPRLIFTVGSEGWDDKMPREFDLRHPVTTIGSAPDSDLPLAGLTGLHAEIRHDDRDEYVLYVYGDAELSSQLKTTSELEADEEQAAGLAGAPRTEPRVLRTGARVDLGDWQMSYYREEFADHGRPFGGREGGELEVQLDQSGKPLDQADG